MALEENSTSPFTMPVQPMYGGYGNNGGLFGNGDLSWLILLLLCGWGGFGGMGGFGMGGMMWPMMMGGMYGGFDLYPWLNNSQHISDGFRDQFLNTQIGDLRTDVNRGFGDVQTSLCSGFAGVNAGIANAAAQAEISANARQMANMQQLFGIQSAQQQCCCDTRAGIADLRYTVATEACADRAAVSDALRDVIAANTASTQRILDQLCADKIEAKNDTIAQLRSELLYARGQAAAESIYQRGQNSQDVQTAQILAGQQAIPGLVYNRLNECPVSTVPVYGRQPIFTCNNNGCGCGCGNAANF